jgi:adenylate cyclase
MPPVRQALLIALLTGLLACALCLPADSQGLAVNGTASVGDADLRRGVDLDGEWEMYPSVLLGPGDFARAAGGAAESVAGGSGSAPALHARPHAARVLIRVPASWSATYPGLKPQGAATYRLVLRLPDHPAEPVGLHLKRVATAYRLYGNGSLLAENGTVSPRPEGVQGSYAPRTVFISASGVLEIILQCANGEDVVAGPLVAPRAGYQSAISSVLPRDMSIDAVIFAAILMMGLYHIILSILHPEEKASLYFGLMAAVLALRGGLTGARLLHLFAGGLSFHTLISAEFITVYLAGAVIFQYFSHLFPQECPRFARIPVLAVSAAYCILSVLAPIPLIVQFHLYYEVFLLAEGVLIVVWLVRSLVSRREGAVIMMAGFGVMLASAVYDILLDLSHAGSSFLSSYAMLVFILLQSVLIARKYARAFVSARESSRRNEAMAASYSRFVPREFLSLLGKQSIESVSLGDQVEMRMTVLFADIRSFTTLSENMTPVENFNFLNSYLSRISPVIRAHGGFIDKYIGDGIMSLFPGSPQDAVRAGLELLATVRLFNVHRANSGYRPISIGIGINTGTLMLGTVGEASRMEGTVISDAVNLASRLEGLTRTFGSWIIASGELLEACSGADWMRHRYLGRVHVKGKSQAVAIHEIIDEPDSARLATRERFEAAVRSLESRRTAEAAAGFHAVLEEDPADHAAAYYVGRITGKGPGMAGDRRAAL